MKTRRLYFSNRQSGSRRRSWGWMKFQVEGAHVHGGHPFATHLIIWGEAYLPLYFACLVPLLLSLYQIQTYSRKHDPHK